MDIAASPAPKIAVVVRSDLEVWQKLNVAGFLVSGIGTTRPDLIGEPYADASGGAVVGPRRTVDKALDKLRLHP